MSWNTDQDSDSESDEFGTFRFKEKQKRTNFSEYQLEQLHMMLNRTYYYPSKKEKDDLSKIIQLRPAVVRVCTVRLDTGQ